MPFLPSMCGIFAYMGKQPLPISQVLEVLRILEKEQEAEEGTPVGGHGAGIAYLDRKAKLTLNKVGKTKRSPSEDLKRQITNAEDESQFILSHVRHASPEFEKTIKSPECAQPYGPNCVMGFTVVSAHNGFVTDYKELKSKLRLVHSFESEKINLIDSEVIPHVFEELLIGSKDSQKAAHTLFEKIHGTTEHGNTVVVLSKESNNNVSLSVIQKGRTRGLVVWNNSKSGILLCSREGPVRQTMSGFLAENGLNQAIKIRRQDSINMEVHFGMKVPE